MQGLAGWILVIGLVAAAGDGERAAEITGDSVRFRAGPGTVHAILGELNRGDLVVVLSDEGAWKKVRVPGGFPCFVHESLVRVDEDGTAVVTKSRVLLRPTAGKELLPLETRLERGDVLPVIGRKEDWIRVVAPERAFAYVYGEFVRDLGPAEEHSVRISRAAEARRERLLAGRSREDDRIRLEKERQENREAVLSMGDAILDGEGDAKEMRRRLTRIVLESDDDLTRGYANSLLALIGLREEAEKLRERVEKAEGEKADAVDDLRAERDEAVQRYEEALEKVRALRSLRENPFRGVGRIEKRGENLVLEEKGRVLFRLRSKRFELSDYVGRRVGVNGRMVGEDPDTGERLLMVEKLEILEPAPGDR